MALPKPSRAFSGAICRSCRQRLLPQTDRPFSSSTSFNAEAGGGFGGLGSLSRTIEQTGNIKRRFENRQPQNNESFSIMDAIEGRGDGSLLPDNVQGDLNAFRDERPHRMHVYAHKHNTHITLVQPSKSAAETTSSRVAGARVTSEQKSKMIDTLLSVSTGNIGFRKAGRGSYDAAFQLTAFVLRQIQEKGMMSDLKHLEVILRGFGAGREAVTKALLGTEGRRIRGRIVSVSDATRLKQGGPRSKKPRRLG